MPIEFQVSLEDKVGSLAWLSSVLDAADVNIDAIQGRSGRGVSVVHFIPDNPEAAGAALSEEGIPYSTRDVLVLNILDQAGALRDVALVLAESGINIDCVYGTIKGGVVIGVDDIAGATQVASGLAVIKPEGVLTELYAEKPPRSLLMTRIGYDQFFVATPGRSPLSRACEL